MSPRDNLLRILHFDHPAYVMTGLPAHTLAYVGAGHEHIDGSGGDGSPAGARWTDIWGVGWHKELLDVMGLTEYHPLADITRVDDFVCPDPYDPRIAGPIHADPLEFDREQQFLVGTHRDTLFEQAYMLVGMENLMIAFYEEPEAVKTLFHRIIDFHLGLAAQYVARGVEWATLGDDLGSQRGPLFSREILEEFFLPEYRRLLGFYKAHGVRINFHSCGCIASLLEDFIALGVDILNPLQASANDLAQIRTRTQGRLTLQGAIPSDVLVNGPIERIRAEVREKIALLGRDGGYLCSPDQGMPWPADHYAAFRAAVEEYGQYPIGR